MRIAIVGVTGMVGQIILKVLAERSFPVTELIPVASEKSVGKQIQFGGRAWVIQNIEMQFLPLQILHCSRPGVIYQ